MPTELKISVNSSLFLRDPEETDLGRKMIQHSIIMIDRMGLDQFTFKKLAQEIQSTEASMYRYFESKHMLLYYLLSWYWTRSLFLFDYQTSNISDPVKKIRIALEVLLHMIEDDPATTHVDEGALSRIAVLESAKVYRVGSENKSEREAKSEAYHDFCQRIAKVMKEVSPRYRYPKSLVIAVISTIQRQSFYLDNLPTLTDIKKSKTSKKELAKFVEQLVFRTLGVEG
ncbi:MAG: TetR/AcrR family transcriptional regulator [Bdellovibrionales bacterium]|nr:TetR/AcrR family transcriptional regulator [Bdellovibrionales bacterium]